MWDQFNWNWQICLFSDKPICVGLIKSFKEEKKTLNYFEDSLAPINKKYPQINIDIKFDAQLNFYSLINFSLFQFKWIIIPPYNMDRGIKTQTFIFMANCTELRHSRLLGISWHAWDMQICKNIWYLSGPPANTHFTHVKHNPQIVHNCK